MYIIILQVLTLVVVVVGDINHPVLSHFGGRFWYYHTGGPLHVQAVGTGGDVYQGDAYHPLHHDEAEGSPLGPSIGQERLLVLPASTQLLNTRGHQPLQGSTGIQQPDHSLLVDSPVTHSLLSDSWLSDSFLSDSLPSDSFLSDSSIEDLETTEGPQPSLVRLPLGRVEELRPGSGRIIQPKRLVSGSRQLVWNQALIIMLVLVISII